MEDDRGFGLKCSEAGEWLQANVLRSKGGDGPFIHRVEAATQRAGSRQSPEATAMRIDLLRVMTEWLSVYSLVLVATRRMK